MMINPQIQHSTTGRKAAFKGRMGLSLLHVVAGDTVTLRGNWIGQVDGFTGAVINSTGLDVRFRWTQDKLASSGWSAFSNLTLPSLGSMLIDASLPLFFEFEVKNTGSVTNYLHSIVLEYDVNENVSGQHGFMSIDNVYDELPEIIKQMAFSFAPVKDSGLPCIEFMAGNPEGCANSPQFLKLYVDQIRTENGVETVGYMDRTSITAFIGLRTECTQEQKPFFNPTWGAVKKYLGGTGISIGYEITLNGVKHLGVNLDYFGIKRSRMGSDADRTPPSEASNCGCRWRETLWQADFITYNQSIQQLNNLIN